EERRRARAGHARLAVRGRRDGTLPGPDPEGHVRRAATPTQATGHERPRAPVALAALLKVRPWLRSRSRASASFRSIASSFASGWERLRPNGSCAGWKGRTPPGRG